MLPRQAHGGEFMNLIVRPCILMNIAMWDANTRVKSFCGRLKQQVNPVSAAELGTAMKI